MKVFFWNTCTPCGKLHLLATGFGVDVRAVDIVADEGADCQKLSRPGGGDSHEDEEDDEDHAALAIELHLQQKYLRYINQSMMGAWLQSDMEMQRLSNSQHCFATRWPVNAR